MENVAPDLQELMLFGKSTVFPYETDRFLVLQTSLMVSLEGVCGIY